MDPLIAILTIIVIVLAALLIVVGIQVIVILRQFKTTLDHLNRSLANADQLLQTVARPFHGLGDTMAGIKSGLVLAETFITWVKDNHDQPKK